MIEPYEMAQIYWRRIRGGAIFEVEHLLKKSGSTQGKEYWNEVLTFLNIRKNGKKSLN